MSLNENFGFVWARMKSKHSFRLNKSYNFSLCNKFKNFLNILTKEHNILKGTSRMHGFCRKIELMRNKGMTMNDAVFDIPTTQTHVFRKKARQRK